MVEVSYKPSFIRQFKKLPQALQEEALDKIELFKDPENHAYLRVHKLKGWLEADYSFSVNFRYRIVFMWEVRNKSAILLAIGDHAVYD